MSNEKRSWGEVALLRVIKSKVEEEMEKEDKVKEEVLVMNTLPLTKFAHICKTVRKKEERTNLLRSRKFTPLSFCRSGDFGRF